MEIVRFMSHFRHNLLNSRRFSSSHAATRRDNLALKIDQLTDRKGEVSPRISNVFPRLGDRPSGENQPCWRPGAPCLRSLLTPVTQIQRRREQN
jgi:hypothetical protein